MLGVALVLLGIAAAIHVYIFVLESLLWTSPGARRIFGTSIQEADATRQLAYNQGFYNLFLAAMAVAAIFALGGDHDSVGTALAVCGAGSMVGAGLVLVISDRSKARSALIQLLPPALGLLALALR